LTTLDEMSRTSDLSQAESFLKVLDKEFNARLTSSDGSSLSFARHQSSGPMEEAKIAM
jgi:hypothetical protein